MNIITKKVRLIPAPVPFIGTRIKIALDDPDSLTWGIFATTAAEGHSKVVIDWGDGMREEFRGNAQPIHTYAQPGEYIVRISDNISNLQCSVVSATNVFRAVYAPMIREFMTSATYLLTLDSSCFQGAVNLSVFRCEESGLRTLALRSFALCSSLNGRLDFPCVTDINASTFVSSPGITELRFGSANKETIISLPGYATAFGATNATITFYP